VVVKIDQDRMKGAKEVIARIRKPGEGAGIPWFAFLDADGRIIITFPRNPAPEISVSLPTRKRNPILLQMLKTTRSKLTDADLDLIGRRVGQTLASIPVDTSDGTPPKATKATKHKVVFADTIQIISSCLRGFV